MSSSLAASTRSNLRTAANHFDLFVRRTQPRQPFRQPRWEGDLQATLHNEETFMLFAIHLIGGSSRQANTVLNYCSLLRTHFATLLGFPLASVSPRWKSLVRAIKKRHTRERKHCRPLRAEHLRRSLYGGAVLDSAAATTRRAAIATGWATLMRPKELIRLRRSDLTMHRDHAVLCIKPLKKGPEQQPVPTLIARGNGSGADAFSALERMLRFRNPAAPADAPLFSLSGEHPLTTPLITQWVQEIASAAGEPEDAHQFTARSMRVGGATEYAALGLPEHLIATLGRWSSDIGRIYMRASAGSVLHASALMSGAPADPTLEDIFPGYVQTARR